MNKKIFKIALLMLLAVVSLGGCAKWKNEEFTLVRQPYEGNELRTDGFYYQTWDNGTKFSDITFLFRNGVVLQWGDSDNMSELDESASQSLNAEHIRDKNAFWGVFLVENDKIIYERLRGSQLGYLVYREEGNIINDTTFVMTEVSRMNQGEKTETRPVERTYYFRQFSPKPDSTNMFIP